MTKDDDFRYDRNARMSALDMAVRSARASETRKEVVKRAKAYHAFLMGGKS